MKPPPKLSSRQERFCMEFLFDGNARQAAARAGYSIKGSPNAPHQLLKLPQVQEHLEKLRGELREKYRIANELVIRELAIVAFADIGNYLGKGNTPVDIEQLEPEQRRAVASVKLVNLNEKRRPDHLHCNIKLHDKIRALDLLSRILGMYKEQPEVHPSNWLRELVVIPAELAINHPNFVKNIEEGHLREGYDSLKQMCEKLEKFEQRKREIGYEEQEAEEE